MARGVTVLRIPVGLRAVWGIVFAFALAVTQAAETPVAEWDLKAAFVPKFPLFVEWPAGTFKTPADPVIIGVLGTTGVIPHLEKAIAGKVIGGRPLRLVRCREPAEARNFQIVFLAVEDSREAADLLRQLEGSRALTVSDVSDFAREGGMVNLVTDHKRIRLEVNLEAVRRAELRMDPQFLQVAKAVKTAPKGGS